MQKFARANQSRQPTPGVRFAACRAPVARRGCAHRWMNTSRIGAFLLVTTLFLTGCYTYTQAPGAVGKVVDADTGAPVLRAQITRPQIPGGLGGRMGVPSEG